MIQSTAYNPGSLARTPQKLSLQKIIKESIKSINFRTKGNQKSQVYKVSWKNIIKWVMT